jgi:predicted type IV restriction endonuclease
MDRGSARREIESLVGAFEKNRAHYLSGEFDEAKARSEFIDPFFEALGWDVRNPGERRADHRLSSSPGL